MKFFIKSILLFLVLFSFLVPNHLFAAATKDELKIGSAQEFESLNKVIARMSASKYILDMCVRSLVSIDLDGNWVPLLVKEIPSLENGLAELYEENGKKKIKATFELIEKAKWGDGTEMTNKDVLFTWKVGMSDNVNIGEKEIWSQIERIELDPTNNKKFTFYYEKAKWDFYQLAQFDVLPEHLEGKIFEKNKDVSQGYDKNTLYQTNPTNPGLYNGPYRITEVKLGSHVILEPNTHFYGKQPYFKKVVVKVIQNTSALEANLLSGTIDMISSLGLPLDQALALEKRIKKEKLPYVIDFVPSLLYEHIDLQLSNEILKDIKVRKALVHGIDRDKLSNAFFGGKQPKAIHSIAPIDPWFTDDPKKIVTYEYSKRKAKKLLEEAGWKMGNDGYRYKDGKKLSFQLMTTAGNKTRELIQTYLQAEWKKIGVEITIKNEPARVYFGTTVKESKFPAMAMFAWFSAPENTPRSTYHSSSIPTAANSYSGQNDTRWVNPEVDKIIEEIDTTFSHEKRKELIAKALYHYTNDVPVIPLYYRSNNAVIPANMKGYRSSPHQYSECHYIENWYLEE